MQLTVDRIWMLEIAQSLLPGEPAVTDWGALTAAEARHAATIMDHDPAYTTPEQRAAALLHCLVRVPALEHSNALFGLSVAAGFLHASGRPAKATTADAESLVAGIRDGSLDVWAVEAALTTWTS
ncbi:fic family toxin-antitoxin system, toxin component [Streptomyces erythrochromogenes]|uniref:fic family toxin-antitoxin system, toxin component n=1 Tax=Streptomyces erythrochromogenes TaxID=285574 RepID=UPI003443B49C